MQAKGGTCTVKYLRNTLRCSLLGSFIQWLNVYALGLRSFATYHVRAKFDHSYHWRTSATLTLEQVFSELLQPDICEKVPVLAFFAFLVLNVKVYALWPVESIVIAVCPT
jgi:hypothetical protein